MFALVLIAATVVIKAPPVVRPVTCDPVHFIGKAYQDLLGRPIDAAASNYWLGQMKNGVTRTQVAAQLLRSGQAPNARVQNFYSQFLHRPGSPSEVAYFAGMLQQGASIEQVEAGILGSAEYFAQRGGGTNSGFLAALYQDVLGRPADPPAIALWMQQLASGASRSAIAQQVSSSAEARQRWVNALYNRYLHHGPTGAVPPGGQDQVAAAIIGSDEYCRQ